MTIGYIGLGKMGFNMVTRLQKANHKLVVFNKTPEATKKLARKKRITATYSIEELTNELKSPRTIWLMVPHQAVDSVIKELTPQLSKGDTVIDGGNSPYTSSIKHYTQLKKKGIHFLDVGVSGGPSGALNGASLMVGGDKSSYKKYTKLFKNIAAPRAFGYMGKTGSGHFVKMVHNGIEYGMMQAIAEGFDIMNHFKPKIDLKEVARVYTECTVISSRLVTWMHEAFKEHGVNLRGISRVASHSGEGLWTIEYAHKHNIPDTVIHKALKARIKSQKKPNYQAQIISALRNQFGGHENALKRKR